MADTEQRPELLVLLENELDPLKLVVTWQKAFFDYGQSLPPVPLPQLSSADEFSQRWARIAGVDPDDVEHWAPVLFENGILMEGGQVDQALYEYCRDRGKSTLSTVQAYAG